MLNRPQITNSNRFAGAVNTMSLTILPPELFSCVVANLESKPTLCNLARCSRQFYLHTVPHLYRHVTIEKEFRPNRHRNVHLRNLASLLIRRPDLARLVRYFTLHDLLDKSDNSQELEESEEHVSPETVKVDQVFKTAVNALNLPEEAKFNWLRQGGHTHKCHPDLILALLLPALLKVERLVLDLKYPFHTYYLEQVLRSVVLRERPFDIQPAFEALKFFSCDVFNIQSTGFIASLLKLPAIRQISGQVTSDELSEGRNLMEFDNTSSSLTCLDLAAYKLTTADLGHILRAPKALKTFVYTVFPRTTINFTQITHALGSQKNCLQRLSFDYDEVSYRHSYNRRMGLASFGPVTSLINLNTLKVFQTAALFLQTLDDGTERHSLINIFPPSLETLHVTHCQLRLEDLLALVEHLLVQKSPQQIPSLTKLILEDKSSPILRKGTQEIAVERLLRVAATQGVSVELI